MSDKPQVQIDSEELEAALFQAAARTDGPGELAIAAYMQASFANQAAIAIATLLRHKGIVSEAELQKALGDAYHAEATRKKNSGKILAPAPMLKPNGSF